MSQSNVTVKSFSQMLDEVKNQVELSCLDGEERGVGEELCLIIAEIYRLPGNIEVRIGGADLPCELVAEIYSRLTANHFYAVIEKFLRAEYPIKRRKAYLRTALYNQVFEQESGEANEFRSTFSG